MDVLVPVKETVNLFSFQRFIITGKKKKKMLKNSSLKYRDHCAPEFFQNIPFLVFASAWINTKKGDLPRLPSKKEKFCQSRPMPGAGCSRAYP